MNGYDTEGWHDFLVAAAGAGAGLAGLVFVAISINIKQIVAEPGLPGRAAEALIMLISMLLFGLAGLIPGQGRIALGVEFLLMGLVLWTGVAGIALHPLSRPRRPTWRQATIRYALAQAATLPLIIAGISLLAGFGGGLYWLPVSALFCLSAGTVAAWVLLIEILR